MALGGMFVLGLLDRVQTVAGNAAANCTIAHRLLQVSQASSEHASLDSMPVLPLLRPPHRALLVAALSAQAAAHHVLAEALKHAHFCGAGPVLLAMAVADEHRGALREVDEMLAEAEAEGKEEEDNEDDDDDDDVCSHSPASASTSTSTSAPAPASASGVSAGVDRELAGMVEDARRGLDWALPR
jgi:hypothetical protein